MNLDINFAPRHARQGSLRMGIGTAILVLMLGVAWTITSETEAGLPHYGSQMPSEDEILAINKAVDELNFPWQDVLTLVETSVDETVRISQFDADAREGRLNLNGEALDSRAILELPARLRASSTVIDARVTSQSPANNQEATGCPIRFALEVSFRQTSGSRQ